MAVNLRNKPIDRRRLSAEDKQAYRPAKRMQAHARAAARRGQQAQRRNKPPRTVERKPGTGGFTQGIAIQQARLREEGAKVRRSKALRPTADNSMYEIYQR